MLGKKNKITNYVMVIELRNHLKDTWVAQEFSGIKQKCDMRPLIYLVKECNLMKFWNLRKKY